MDVKDVTAVLERTPRREEQSGVRLSGLYAVVEDYGDGMPPNLIVNGEIEALNGALPSNVQVSVLVNDANARLIGTVDWLFFQDEFMGFDHFSLILQLPPQEPIARIRVLTKPAST